MRAHRARALAVPSRLSAGEPAGTDFLEDNDPLSSEHTTPASGHLYANLLAACGQQSFATFDQLFNSIVSREQDKFEKIAEGKKSEVFRVHTYTGDSVLKVVKLGSTQESQDRLLTKIKIASRLTELREGLDYFTKGFVELTSVTCVFDSYPAELLEARERAALHDERRDGNKSVRTPRAYLAWHMSYGGVPLDQLKLDSTVQIWSILHQVALSLAVAEEALEFEHRALLMRRVLVKYTLEKTSRFTIRGRDYLIETWFLKACILGGASARLSDGDTAVFTVTENHLHEPIDRALPDVDYNMKMIIRNDWRAFYPVTNLLWLHHVTKKLRRQYKQTFGSYMNNFEKVFWTDISSWKQELLQYSSLAEFVNNLPDVRAQRRQGCLTTTTTG
ncbi:serine/threonine-protein kinase haspin-like [Dermacentor variabilis]|uniref:serine/threonine-protein kinase haspin-like n=1 Tax=Dermacentor variabilis TaxID=34621 RepID=UPI003F5C61F1